MNTPLQKLMGALMLLALAGCASTQRPGPATAPISSASQVIPANAQWTIVCRTFTGEEHHVLASQIKQQMLDSGLDGAYILEAADQSTLYYGYYANRADPRVRADIERLVKWTDMGGEHPFPHPLLVELDPKDPAAPPQWDLRNAKGYWSLEIAAYRDSPQRKQAAVDSVRAAREQGIQAYYYQGETISSVCIGAWPRDALKEQATDHAGTSAANADEPIMVTNVPLNDIVHGPLIDRVTGQQVKVFAPKVQIQDPTLIAAMKKYPYHYVNGTLHAAVTRDPRTGQEIETPDPSFIVVIPGAQQRYEAKAHGDVSPAPANAASEPPPALLGIQPAQPQGGKLKSLGQ